MRGFKGGVSIVSVSCATLAYGYSHPATAWLSFSRGISFAAGASAPAQAAKRTEAV